MARSSSKQDFAPILAAFRQWIDRCLIGDSSVFTPEALWTGANVEEVRSAFVDHPDEGADDFSTKLRGQMKATSPSAQRLMAEMLWALLLFPSNVGADTKRKQVRDLWGRSGSQLEQDHPLLADKVLAGIGSGGPGFNNHRWRELAFLISLTTNLKEKGEAARRQIFTNYDALHCMDGRSPPAR